MQTINNTNNLKLLPDRPKGKTAGILRSNFVYIFMALPGALYLLVNNYLPMAGLIIAFKNIDYSVGILKSPWYGFNNFRYLFLTSDAFVITRNTIAYNAIFIIVNTIVAVVAAILLSEVGGKFFLRVYQSLLLLPYLISMIIVAYLVYAFLSVDTGILNKSILPLFGIKGIEWYSEPKFWPFILPIVWCWKNVGFLCVVYFASVIGIDKEYFEAATLDGASKWQQIRKITLPLLKPIITVMILLAIGRIFYSDFGLFYQVPMDSGMLYPTTNVIDTYVYRGLLQIGNIGMASAAGFYQSLVGFTFVMISNWIVRRLSPENALF
ncbi:MAG: ABC transporter permease [Saccharofermentanales bacterium]|jgi:putative aldouronate transport system permease protein